MSEWKKVKLGELYEVHNGLSKGRQFFGSGYPFLTFSTVFNNYFLPKELDSLVQSSEKEREACSIRKGDVFITRTSETMDELGMSSVALRDYPDATYNGFTKRLRPITDDVIPEYIGYYLRSPKFRGKFMAFSTMTTRASLANGDLLGMEVELPTKEEQHCIASILSRYDSLIENYQKQIKLLEEAAQRLYKEWFVDLHFPGHENTKFVDGVPEGWEKKSVKTIVELQSGYAFKSSDFASDGIYKIVTIKNVKDGAFDGENVSKIASIPEKMPKHCILEDGDILLSLTGNVGRVCIVVGKNYLLNQRVAKLKSIFKAYTYCLFRSRDMFIDVNNLANGAAQQNVSPIKIGEMKILIPENKLLNEFEKESSNYISGVIAFQSQIRLLTEARDRLLPKMMSGEIEFNFK